MDYLLLASNSGTQYYLRIWRRDGKVKVHNQSAVVPVAGHAPGRRELCESDIGENGCVLSQIHLHHFNVVYMERIGTW